MLSKNKLNESDEDIDISKTEDIDNTKIEDKDKYINVDRNMLITVFECLRQWRDKEK